MEFNGRRVLVTGAGKGIGRATAIMLSQRGAKVVALSRNAADLETLTAETGCKTILAELADTGCVIRAAHQAMPVDDLVNCAGITTLEPLLELNIESLDAIMAVNLRAPVVLAREVARGLVERRAKGAIVNVSSIASSIGIREHVAYCASKGALDAATRAMALELGPCGIRVNTVNPVVTMTPMAVKAWSDPEKASPMLARVPVGRFVEPEEVAEAICWLLSDASAMVSGTSLVVDGGFLAN